MFNIAWVVVASLNFNAATAEMERAVLQGDEATLQRLAGEYRDVLDSDVDDRDPRSSYAFAYVSWRLAGFQERGSKPYERLLKDAEKELKRVLETSPRDAEGHALLGTVNGWLITGMWSAMRRGPRADKAYKKARELEPENPRVAMLQGQSRLFRPAAFGGGVDKAEEELSTALALFEKEPKDKPWPNGGHAEIQAWMGQVMEQKGELDRAREFYERALELEPDYQWVRDTLLPALDESMKSR